jgi:Kdo2-lipid IVA lauroyltransferase/acyltransferase
VMPPSNPYVFEWLARLRMSVGLSEQVNAGEGVYRAFRKRLRDGHAAIVLADQRLVNGIRAPFFGRDVVTNVIPARLARTLKVAVVPLAVRRVAGRAAHFEVEFMAPLEFDETGDAEADEKQFTARINGFYESEILRAPGQWLWVDPRWDEY